MSDSDTQLIARQQMWQQAMTQSNSAPIYGLGALTTGTTTTIGNSTGMVYSNGLNWIPSNIGTTVATLDPKTAEDLIAQLEHDKVIVADHKLLFGQYMGKSLREVPVEYIVQLGAAMRGARMQIAKELRRRRALKRLTSQP